MHIHKHKCTHIHTFLHFITYISKEWKSAWKREVLLFTRESLTSRMRSMRRSLSLIDRVAEAMWPGYQLIGPAIPTLWASLCNTLGTPAILFICLINPIPISVCFLLPFFSFPLSWVRSPTIFQATYHSCPLFLNRCRGREAELTGRGVLTKGFSLEICSKRFSWWIERERERERSWVQPLHSTMASSELRDMFEVIEKWENWVLNPRRSASSVTTYHLDKLTKRERGIPYTNIEYNRIGESQDPMSRIKLGFIERSLAFATILSSRPR